MAERKVLNKYFPPDFDPNKIPKKKRYKDMIVKVRMMLPMNVRCSTCGEYLYRGTKFNSRKEDVEGEDYLGIRIYRFYMKCTGCSAEFSIKTDPQNSDYQCESGVSRNFEPWRQNLQAQEAAKKAREEEEQGDAMKELENRTEESKRELDIYDALEEIREHNQKLASADVNEVIEQRMKYHDKKERELSQIHQKEIENAFKRRKVLTAEDEKAEDARLQAKLKEGLSFNLPSSSSSDPLLAGAKLVRKKDSKPKKTIDKKKKKKSKKDKKAKKERKKAKKEKKKAEREAKAREEAKAKEVAKGKEEGGGINLFGYVSDSDSE